MKRHDFAIVAFQVCTMWVFRTFWAVPPIPLQAWARAVVVFAAYLAAVEFGLPWQIDPLAFALFIEAFLLSATNWIFRIPDFVLNGYVRLRSGLLIQALIVIFYIFLLFCDGMLAATLWAAYYLSYPIALFILSSDKRVIQEQPTIWFQTGDHADIATKLYAVGWIANSCILLWLVQIGDPLVIIAFVTFGAKLVEFLTNWTVLLLLYLLWREEEGD